MAFSQVPSKQLPEQEIARLYAEHGRRVLQMLPPHSALPPLLDLSRPNDGGQGAGKKWEDRLTGSMGVRPVDYDPGVRSADELTSTSVTTTEYAGQPSVLPGRSCQVVAIARPIRTTAHLAYNHRFVYSVFDLELLDLFKGQSRHGVRAGAHVAAAQLGASVRFVSGHQATFWEANEGFMALDKQYLLFLWKPVPSSDTYMVDEAYLLQNGRVFPIGLNFGEKQYSDTPADTFIRNVREIISKNIDGP